MAVMKEYERYDATGLARLVNTGKARPADILSAAIERAEARNPEINAIVIPMFEEARAAISSGLPKGPFSGVPFLIKDLHAPMAGVRMTNGSRLFADYIPDHDSEMVKRYRYSGLVTIGKSASPEFGITTTTESVLFGATKNPWRTTHSAGGSSGGAAAAVAAGIVPIAHASDGGGSIRIPASCCGLFGLKPTRARNPSGPDAGEGWAGMSIAHVISRSVRDSAVALDVTRGTELGAPYWAPPPSRSYADDVGAPSVRLRIGVQTQAFNGVDVHPDCASAAQDAAVLCEELGHDVVETQMDVDSVALARAVQVVIASNLRMEIVDRAAALGRELSPEDVEPGTFALAEAAREFDATDYARSVVAIHAIGRQVAEFFERYDMLLTPTMATPPLELGRLALTRPDQGALTRDVKKTIGFTQLFNASGNPAMSVPLYWNSGGLPIGVQFAGAFGDETQLIRLASKLEEARPWFDRRPDAG